MAYSAVPDYQLAATQVPLKRFAGISMFMGPVSEQVVGIDKVGTVAAAGSAQSSAAVLPLTPSVLITSASGTNGVILPRIGKIEMNLFSNAATNAVLVYPPVGGTINGGTSNASVSLAARTYGSFSSLDGLNWTGSPVT
jgi:hypothetical protein